jgi:outer membrane protein TolC
MSLTPMQVEKRLLDLSKEIDEAHKDLIASEQVYHTAKAALEIAMARARMSVSHPDMKLTSVQREDEALIRNAEQHMQLAMAEAQVKGARANANRIRTQVDIARSISVSVRASMEII